MATGSKTILERLTGTWERMVFYFVPHSMAVDSEAHNQARMFLISHALGPIIGGTVPLFLYLLDPTPGFEIAILAASILSFWLFPFLLRAGVDYGKLVLFSITIDWFVIFWSCYFYGGATSPTMVWFLIIPILALFYIGGDSRHHRGLIAIAAASTAVFAAAYLLIEPPHNDIPDGAMFALGAVSTVAVLCYVAMMAIYYAKIYDAGVQLEIEAGRRRRMAEQLREAILAAHRVGSAKAEFLARMSHEIRTPINAVIGYAQILKEDAELSGDKMLEEDIERILDAARYLIRLINMILDLAKIGAGRMRFDVREHDPSALIEAAVEEQGEALSRSRNKVEVAIEPSLDVLHVDRHRLLQILECVLSNAIRHTRNGEVRISARQARLDGAEAIAIAVSDTGEGIEPEALATLFQTFATKRNAAAGRYGGTGLNLAVCAQLCRAMGGEISASSVRGEGSTFTITLPLRPEPRASVAAATSSGEATAIAA
jgi:signal transduction histidine kinase